MSREHRHQVGGKRLRNHHGSVIGARFHTFDGLVFTDELPVKLIVDPQGADNLIACVDAGGNEVGLVSLVGRGYGHLDVARVGVWVPKAQGGEPRVQRRHQHQTRYHNGGDNVAEQVAHVAGENGADHFHEASPPVRWETFRRRSSRLKFAKAC